MLNGVVTVPPGTSIKSQMTNSAGKREKNTNLKIYVQHAINCTRSYGTFKSILTCSCDTSVLVLNCVI